MNKIEFTIRGQPRGKGRPRHMRNGHTYTDQKTRDYENSIRIACKAENPGVQAFSHAVRVFIHATMKMPSSAPKRAKTAMLCGMVQPETKPDIDNIVKAVLDGCNGIAFRDDKQVVDLRAIKTYGDDPGIYVRVTEVEPFD